MKIIRVVVAPPDSKDSGDMFKAVKARMRGREVDEADMDEAEDCEATEVNPAKAGVLASLKDLRAHLDEVLESLESDD